MLNNVYLDCFFKAAAISADEWYAGKDADPVIMSMLDVFMAAQSSRDGGMKVGGVGSASVLRQASRRLADKLNESTISTMAATATTTTNHLPTASMSRLGHHAVSMKPPQSSSSVTTTPSVTMTTTTTTTSSEPASSSLANGTNGTHHTINNTHHNHHHHNHANHSVSYSERN